ncbi:hypothetical protein KIH74_35390 [Kineosporia sp. J2-2]|uniref:Uncharacterized protein n=1 Tax=Kineosporia corallincola TaxID=2835133 RepID=A0ABS5TTZ8_9ACTN|nr:hypothetical protein [Kineosporia corallincola]MBT0774282.1 hypothetical protein [Kineosporia corallincola]
MEDPQNWSVLLFAPQSLEIGLMDEVLTALSQDVIIQLPQQVTATDGQVTAHFTEPATDDPDTEPTLADLRRSFVGHEAGIALAYATDDKIERSGFQHTAALVRRLFAQLGGIQQHAAPRSTEFATAEAISSSSPEMPLAGLVHSSANPARTDREFAIWYGPLGGATLTPDDAWDADEEIARLLL